MSMGASSVVVNLMVVVVIALPFINEIVEVALG